MPNRRQPTPEQYPEILERAADILESERVAWCQGTYFRRDMKGSSSFIDSDYRPPLSACALGAIRIAAVGEDASYRGLTDSMPTWLGEVESDLDDILTGYLADNIPLDESLSDYPDWGGMAIYNDVPGREKAEVIEVFKQVAKDMRNAPDQ
jgi:hypothetical protein